MREHFFQNMRGRADCSDFARYAAALLIGRGDIVAAQQVAASRGWDRPATIIRAAATAGTTADAQWAGQLVDHRRMAAGFVESLRSVGVFDGALPAMVRVPLEGALGVVTVGAVGNSQSPAS